MSVGNKNTGKMYVIFIVLIILSWY